MLTHLEPQDPKHEKIWEERKTPQNAVVFGGGERSAAGAAAPLSYGEERIAFGKDTARGPLAGFKG